MSKDNNPPKPTSNEGSGNQQNNQGNNKPQSGQSGGYKPDKPDKPRPITSPPPVPQATELRGSQSKKPIVTKNTKQGTTKSPPKDGSK